MNSWEETGIEFDGITTGFIGSKEQDVYKRQPERYGPWQTVYSRFRKWMEDGILDNIFRVLSLDAELSELSIDASIVQAHQHSAGAKKGGHPTKSDTVAVEQVQKSMPL